MFFDDDASWFRCPHCSKNFFRRDNAVTHIAACPSLAPGALPDEPREMFDARYPLLRVWSLGMRLPAFKADGSRDAVMVVREGQVWECARNSQQVRREPAAEPTPAG